MRIIESSADSTRFHNSFPCVEEDDWCGEYQPSETQDDESKAI